MQQVLVAQLAPLVQQALTAQLVLAPQAQAAQLDIKEQLVKEQPEQEQQVQVAHLVLQALQAHKALKAQQVQTDLLEQLELVQLAL